MAKIFYFYAAIISGESIEGSSVIMIFIAFGQMHLINENADSEVRDLYFGLSLHLHPYFVYASSQVSGKSAHMRRLA